MKTRVTLTIEQKIIGKAKIYAKANGRSLSGIIENYLEAITSNTNNTVFNETPIVQSLKGSFKAPAEFDYKNELTKALNERYR